MSKPSHEVNPCLATSMDRMLPEQQHLKNVVAVPRLTAQAEDRVSAPTTWSSRCMPVTVQLATIKHDQATLKLYLFEMTH